MHAEKEAPLGRKQCMLGRKHPGGWEAVHAEKEAPPEGGIRSMSGRYASYWNAFLFMAMFEAS